MRLPLTCQRLPSECDALAAHLPPTAAGAVQCINKLSSSSDDSRTEEGIPIFSANDEKQLAVFCRQIAPILEKVALPSIAVDSDLLLSIAFAFDCLRLPSNVIDCLRLPSIAIDCVRLQVTLKKRLPKSKHQLGADWVKNIATLAALDVYSVVKVVLDRMRDLVDADRASLFVLDRKKKELWSKVADDLPEIRVKSNAGIVGAVATHGEPLNIVDAYKVGAVLSAVLSAV